MIFSKVSVLKNALVVYDSFENIAKKIPHSRYALQLNGYNTADMTYNTNQSIN